MSLTHNGILNGYSILILAVIYIYFIRISETKSFRNRIFVLILQTTALILLFDIFGRFDGGGSAVRSVLNRTGNFVIFLFGPVLPSLWLLYIRDTIFGRPSGSKPLILFLTAVNAANLILLVMSQFYGWYYSIDASNTYHRGPLYVLSVSLVLLLLVTASVLVIANRGRIERKRFIPLLSFGFPPFICIFLQLMFYGTSLMLNSVVLSVLIMFLGTQTNSIYVDYLTGIYNRKKLEEYLGKKIGRCVPGCPPDRAFSAVMIDLDNFKDINDTYGHSGGDEALKTAAGLLRSCLGPDDFISRYGGDEFCVILDAADAAQLEKTAGKIKRCAEEFNETGVLPFKITMSMGCAVYDPGSGMTAREFQQSIDRLMYQDKHAKRKGKTGLTGQ